jgi:hypothetical protein
MRFREIKLAEFAPTDQIEPQTTPLPQSAPPKLPKQINTNLGTDQLLADIDDLKLVAEENPELEKKITNSLRSLLNYAKSATAKLGITIPPTVEESTAIYSLIDELHSQIEHLEPLGKQVAPIIATIREKIAELKSAIQTGFDDERKKGGEEVKQNIENVNKIKNEYASTITSRVGKSDSWKRGLISALSHYDDQVALDFLEMCANGTALTIKIGKTEQIAKYKLNNIVNVKLKPIFDPENKEIFGSLLRLPFSEGTGFGAGIAPGESLLACLLPGATSAAKGDIEMNGETWEMKAGSYGFNAEKGKLGKSGAWLDCSKVAENAPSLKKVFADSVIKYITNKNKKVTIGKNILSIGDLIKLADFRPTKLEHLKVLFNMLGSDNAFNVLSDTYGEIVPTVKAKNLKTFNAAVKLSLPLIEQNNSAELAKLHVKLSMFEYALGEFKATNFIFYNSTTHDIAIIQGPGSFSNALTPKYNILTSSFTMNGGNKASAGVFLQADSQEEVDKTVGYVRKRVKKNTK